MRQLATIRRVSNIAPIPDADKIEVATVDGWQCVVQKGEFKENDLALYIEVDSWVPQSLAPFLVKGPKARVYNDVPGERVRTIKLRGQLSQGLLLNPDVVGLRSYVEGSDVTDLLEIQLYEKPIPICLGGVVKGNFPSFIPKTDQERVQNVCKLFPRWTEDGEILWEVTEKLDGSSMTIYVKDGEVGVCSRNMDLQADRANVFWRVAYEQNLDNLILTSGKNLAFQGELVGEGVQGNKYSYKGLMFLLFSIYDIDESRYLLPDERVKIATELNLIQVPVIGVYSHNLPFEELLKLADGESQLYPKIVREGVVFKSMQSNRSFKVISNEYLLSDLS